MISSNFILFILLPIIQKSGEILLDFLVTKLLEWLLSDENLKQLTAVLKLQMLILYLDWILQKTEPRELSEQDF